MKLTDSVEQIKGVGEAVATDLKTADITTVGDLINYWPRKYVDFSNVLPVSKLKAGNVTARVQFEGVKGSYRRGGLHITNATASDESGKVAVTWFNQPYRPNSIKTSEWYFISGKLDYKYGKYQIINPTAELVSDSPKHTARILPIYPEKKNLSSAKLRRLIGEVDSVFSQVKDIVPPNIRTDLNLLSRSEAIKELHIPSSTEGLEAANQSLGFEEVFILQLASAITKRELMKWSSPKLEFNLEETKSLLSKIGFKLTDAQRKATWEILQDLDSDNPMNRLLQGDVGSGKTVVAAIAANQALKGGYQVVLMAPTEVLAQQHFKTISNLFLKDVYLLTSDSKSTERKVALEMAENGKPAFFVGTHALIQDKLAFAKLGLAIIDEQHRFGVEQRQKLLKQKVVPHLLSMTATPIPRSLSLTVYGELDISVINELPPGRKPVKTKVLPFTKTGNADKKIAETLEKGEQVYVVCPLIHSSEKLDYKNVEEEYERIAKEFGKDKVGLLHGKLKADQKQRVLERFKKNDISILVATTVIEVGIDVPNASLIIIEGAERFGLAQLHQLRGRVGRSDRPSTCLLVTSPGSSVSQRLRAMEEHSNGFKLAEIDLSIRGPGSVYGVRQHGALDLRIATITDVTLIKQANQAVESFLDSDDLSNHKLLESQVVAARSVTQLN